MTSCQKPCSRCRCMFASGSVASGAASGNAFGKSTLSYFCFRFFLSSSACRGHLSCQALSLSGKLSGTLSGNQ